MNRIIIPGGIGTLDEIFEIFTWHAIGQHYKPVGIFADEQTEKLIDKLKTKIILLGVFLS